MSDSNEDKSMKAMFIHTGKSDVHSSNESIDDREPRDVCADRCTLSNRICHYDEKSESRIMRTGYLYAENIYFTEKYILAHPNVNISLRTKLDPCYYDPMVSTDLYEKRLLAKVVQHLFCLILWLVVIYIVFSSLHPRDLKNSTLCQQEKITVEPYENLFRRMLKMQNIAATLFDENNTVNDSSNWCDECHLLGYFPYNTTTIKHDVTPDLLYKARELIDFNRFTLNSTSIHKRSSIFEENNTATWFSISPDKTANDSSSWLDECPFLRYCRTPTTTPIKHDVPKIREFIAFTGHTLITTAIHKRSSIFEENNTATWFSISPDNTTTIKHDVTPELFYKIREFIDFTRFTLTTTAIHKRSSIFEENNTATWFSIFPDNTVNDSSNWCDKCHLLGDFPYNTTTIKHDVTPDLFFKATDLEFIDFERYVISISPGNTVNDNSSWNWCDEFHLIGCFLNHVRTIKQEVTEDLSHKATMLIDFTRYTLTSTVTFIRKSRFEVYNTASRISTPQGAYDNMMSLGRILIAIGGFIILHTHLSDVNDVSNLREKTTVIQVNTFPFVGLILLNIYLKLGTFFTSIGKNSCTENKLTGMIQNIKKDDAALMKVEGLTTKYVGRIQQINLHIHKFVSNPSSMIPKLEMIVSKTHLDQMKTRSGREKQSSYLSRREWIKCQMCIDRNVALYWCNTCKRSICSFCKLYHEKVWIVKDHDVEALRLLF